MAAQHTNAKRSTRAGITARIGPLVKWLVRLLVRVIGDRAADVGKRVADIQETLLWHSVFGVTELVFGVDFRIGERLAFLAREARRR
jgi:hypothetical protein